MIQTPNILVVSGPSGSGKTTLVKSLLDEFNEFQFSISATTRPKREKETHAVDYYFLSEKDFRGKIDSDCFIEYEEVYPGLLYGTLWKELDRITKTAQKTALLDIDVYGALNIKEEYGQNALLILIHPGSIQNLKKRLQQRKSENPSVIEKRLDKATHELSFADRFDHIIYNDKTIEDAREKVFSLVKKSIFHEKA